MRKERATEKQAQSVDWATQSVCNGVKEIRNRLGGDFFFPPLNSV